ncbi:MAG: hypothetical protein MRJ96_13515 [Nitrospirales bacterium]|nr:hypothetical protein [Nitrospira sp.]MDR4502463.1 hypothetical protein [Nitrospirales bacterium]
MKMGRWLRVLGIVVLLMVWSKGAVWAEGESRVDEILDVLQTIGQNLKDQKYGAAARDFDYVYEIFKEQKGTWLLGCFTEKHQEWVRQGEGKREVVGAAAFGGGTTIQQEYVKGNSKVEAKIMISPMASGLGALLNNPAFRGGGKGQQKRLRNGMTVNVQPREVSGATGGALLSWKVRTGEVSPKELEGLAEGTINVNCVKEITGGQ